MAKRGGGLFALLGIGALGAFYLWKNSAAAKAAGAEVPPLAPGAPAEVPGSLAPTSQQIATSGASWDTLTPVDAIASGYIDFPSGTQAAAADFSNGLTRMDPSSGEYYVQWAGETYVLGQMDAQGNWPATLSGTL